MSAIWRQRWFPPIVPTSLVALALVLGIGVCMGFPCFPTGLRYGLWLDRCPVSDMRLQLDVSANGLVRGDAGRVEVTPRARFLAGEGPEPYVETPELPRGLSLDLALLDAGEVPVDGLIVSSLGRDAYQRRDFEVTLKDVPDGDYLLRIQGKTAFDATQVDLPLALYTPALSHVMTDRPLYEPGQEVLFRSAVLARTDLRPLEGRPGRWKVFAPDGTEMLDERVKTESFGIAAGSFPLDERADPGQWRLRWESGDSSDEVVFRVEHFELPRFSVELESSARWYGIGDTVELLGRARYNSGAPVADAAVAVALRHTDGRWPMPISWEEERETTTTSQGTFSVRFREPVPGDLMERSEFRAIARVTDATGETMAGGARVVVSLDDIAVEHVTELGDGVVKGFNNRVYARITEPDGRPLPDLPIRAVNDGLVGAPSYEARTDADGVAAFQLDPGDPVSVTLPAPPVRSRPFVAAEPQLVTAQHEFGESLTMDESLSLDAILAEVGRCGDYALTDENVSIAVRADRNGVRQVIAGDNPVEQCVAAAAERLRFPADRLHTYSLGWVVPDTLRPYVRTDNEIAWGYADIDDSLERQAALARRCIPKDARVDQIDVGEVHWTYDPDREAVQTEVVRQVAYGLTPTQAECVLKFLSDLEVDDNIVSERAAGTTRVWLEEAHAPGQYVPTDEVRLGYDLKLTAEGKGSTRWILYPGVVPDLRLRLEPTLARPGETLTLTMVRGASFGGTLPERVQLRQGTRLLTEADVKDRAAKFTLPADRWGFVQVEVYGYRAVAFVQPTAPLTVEVASDAETYRPGSDATLTVKTRLGELPVPAGVSLAGVDMALNELAPLLQPDDWGRVTVRATADRPAFEAFDPRALVLGAVRGQNAAQAAVLRVTYLPDDAAGDVRLSQYGVAMPDETEELTTAFYAALEATRAQVAAWEASAPPGEVMTPTKMAEFWHNSVKELGEGATDAYGRPLVLRRLPYDLLAQVDPIQLVSDGTRLPEDQVSWTRFVQEGAQ